MQVGTQVMFSCRQKAHNGTGIMNKEQRPAGTHHASSCTYRQRRYGIHSITEEHMLSVITNVCQKQFRIRRNKQGNLPVVPGRRGVQKAADNEQTFLQKAKAA
jgi:hypothetical protein